MCRTSSASQLRAKIAQHRTEEQNQVGGKLKEQKRNQHFKRKLRNVAIEFEACSPFNLMFESGKWLKRRLSIASALDQLQKCLLVCGFEGHRRPFQILISQCPPLTQVERERRG